MTVLENSYITVSNANNDSATSTYSVTPVFAGEWRKELIVDFDTANFPTNPDRWATVFTFTAGASGATVIGPNTDGTGPPLRTFADIIDNPDGTGTGSIPVVTNTIVNQLYNPTVVRSNMVDDIEISVAQVAIKVNMRNVFYRLLADLGVPGYYNNSLLPLDAVEAIPDGTDLEGPFFDSRFIALDLTIAAVNNMPDNYELVLEVGTGDGIQGYFDLSDPAWSSRDDKVEFRAVPLVDALSFRNTAQLNTDDLIGSLDVFAVPTLRVPAMQEIYPYAPIMANPDILTATLDVRTYVDTSQVAYTAVLTSYRTYNEPPDPGEAPILSWTWTSVGTSETQQGRARHAGAEVVLSDSLDVVDGISARTRHVASIQAIWDPPRYRYFYATPKPFPTLAVTNTVPKNVVFNPRPTGV